MNRNIKQLFITSAFVLLIATSTTFIINDVESSKITKIINQDDDETTISVIAHRGLSSIEIENSFEAIKLGLQDKSTTGVEIDIRLTKDKKIVVIHDDEINNKKVSTSTLEELQKEKIKANIPTTTDYITSLFDNISGNLIRTRFQIVQNKTTKISTLKEILDLYKDYQEKELIIEFKFEDNEDDFIQEFDNLIKEYNYSKIIIQSNDYQKITKMKQLHPEFEYHLIIKKDNYEELKKQDLDGYVIRKNLINYDDINTLLNNNKKVSIWTIASYQDFKDTNEKLQDLNNKVSYITNYPDAINTWQELIQKDKSKIKVKE
ncbi:MAG: hypothetical protein E7162_03695 [Firmicutes bacterium]|nr:hypothetical protein [Bacillota bacterium]